MKKPNTNFPAISTNTTERKLGGDGASDEYIMARKRLVNLNNYYTALNKPNCMLGMQEDVLEPLDVLCDSDEMNKTFAKLISNKQRCLELKEVSIRFSISEMLQLICIENTQSTSNIYDGAKALLEEHTPREVILACWTGFLNLILSKEHTPSGNVEPTFSANFARHISTGMCAADYDSTNFSDQRFDGWTSFLDILRGADQLYIRVDIHNEAGVSKSMIDSAIAFENETLSLTDLLCVDIKERDDTINCLINLIIYNVSLDYSPIQRNSILNSLRTLILNSCKQSNISDDTQYDIFTYPHLETFGLLNSTVPLALLRCLAKCTPPIIKIGSSTQCQETKIRRLLFNESALCKDTGSNCDTLLRIKLSIYYLLACIVNLALSSQLSDLCLPADLPLEAYEFLLDHGISGILFTNLNTLTIHKIKQPVSLAMYMSDQIDEIEKRNDRVNLDAFYATCISFTNSTITKFLTNNDLKELLNDPYSVLISSSDERNRYLDAISLFSHRHGRLAFHQNTCLTSSQSFLAQSPDVSTVHCVPGVELSADELSMLDERIPAKRGTLLWDTLEPKVSLSIATSLFYFLIPCDVEKLSHSPTCLLTIETMSNMCGLTLSPNKEFHNFKLQVLCYASFSHVTRIVDSSHQRLKFMRMIFSLYTSQTSEPEICAPTNKPLAECCLNVLKYCLNYCQRNDSNLNYKPKMNSQDEIFNVVLDTGSGNVHAIVTLTLIILLEMGFLTSMSINLTKLSSFGSACESQEYIEMYLSQMVLLPYVKKIVLSMNFTVLRLDNSSQKFVVLDDDENERLYVTKNYGVRRNFKR